jgi:hypothetical protein
VDKEVKNDEEDDKILIKRTNSFFEEIDLIIFII